MNREKQAVNTSACSLRRRPSPAGISPRYPESICSSPPGGPSSTGVVSFFPPAPHRSAANRCSVRSATTTPCRDSKIPILTTGTSAPTHAVICSRQASSSAHPWPCPSGRTGRSPDIPPAGLAVNAGLRSHRPLALPREPGPQHLTNLNHRHLPEHHPGDLQSLDWEDHTGMKPDKRHTAPLVQLLATGWSHAHGGKHLNLVP